MTTSEKSGVTYASAGVNIDEGNAVVDGIKPLVAATARPGSNPDLGGFGGLFDLKATGYEDPILVAANDGVGTKLKIAIDTGIHNTVGIDLVAMCVNDLIVQGAEPLFFLDYLATGKLEKKQAVEIVAGIAEGCKQAGAALIGGETAEMPGMYQSGDYDLAGFCVGAAERSKLLPRSDIKQGDLILGLASTGVHSNGFSLVRHLISKNGTSLAAPAPFEPDKSLGETLLTPTKIYVKSILKALQEGKDIKGLAHITGGGLTENIPRVLPEDCAAEIDLSALAPPPVFSWLQSLAHMAEDEILRTFNCGIGMIVITSPEDHESVLELLESENESVRKIGEITQRTDESVVYKNTITL